MKTINKLSIPYMSEKAFSRVITERNQMCSFNYEHCVESVRIQSFFWSAFRPIAGKYRAEKLRIGTIFMQWNRTRKRIDLRKKILYFFGLVKINKYQWRSSLIANFWKSVSFQFVPQSYFYSNLGDLHRSEWPVIQLYLRNTVLTQLRFMKWMLTSVVISKTSFR